MKIEKKICPICGSKLDAKLHSDNSIYYCFTNDTCHYKTFDSNYYGNIVLVYNFLVVEEKGKIELYSAIKDDFDNDYIEIYGRSPIMELPPEIINDMPNLLNRIEKISPFV